MVIDFDRPLLLVQNVISSPSYTLNELPDEDKYTELSKRLADVLGQLPKGYDLRKVFLFLLLNSDAEVTNSVAEDENFCHLMGTMPPISFILTLRLIFKLDGLSFLLDLIAYGPSILSVPVIDTILSVDELSPQKIGNVQLILDLSKACFRKMTANGDKNAEKFFSYLVLFQGFDYTSLPNSKLLMNEDAKKGIQYLHNLELFEFTMKKNVPLDPIKCWEGYLMNCSSKNGIKISEPRTVDELTWQYRKVIMSNLNELTRGLTVDNWMGMSEVTYDADKSLQRIVGEKTFQFIELLEEMSNCHRLPDLSAYLEAAMPFALKPEVEVEKIENLSIKEIKSKFSCSVGRNSELMKLYLKSQDIFQDIEKLEIIQDNCDLLDKHDVQLVLFATIQALQDSNIDPSKEEKLKSLSFECMKFLPLEEILEVKQNFFEYFGVESHRVGSEFTSCLLELFKKLSFEPEDISKKWQCESIRLFILNPALFTTKAVQIGLENPNLKRKIAESLCILKPQSETFLYRWISTLNENCQFTKSEMDALPKFALELSRKNVLNKEDFLRKQVIPGIFKAMQASDWNMISMWMSSMQYLLEEIVSLSGKAGSIGVLLVYIGQVLEYCQQSIEEFNWGCVSVRDQALNIIQFLKCFQLSEIEKQWFQCCIGKYSEITVSHLGGFSSSEHQADVNVNFGLCFNAQVKTSEFAAYILVEMLPFLSMDEWCGVADALKNRFSTHNDSSFSVFQSFQKSIWLLIAATRNVDLNIDSPHLSCLDFCVRCIGTVLKTKILPDLKINNYLVVLEEILHLLCKLPSKIWNESGMHILPIIVDIMNKVPSHVEALNRLSAIIMTCPVNQSRELLEDKLKVVFKDAIIEESEVEMNDR